MKTNLRICDLAVGDRVAVVWYPGQIIPAIGTVEHIVLNASRASGTIIRTDHGQMMRIKNSMRITKVSKDIN